MSWLLILAVIVVATGVAVGAFVYVKKNRISFDHPVLSRIPMFSRLPAGDLAKLEKVTQVLRYEAGQVVFKEGDPGDSLFIVAQGQLNVTKKIDGKEQVLKSMRPGEILGEMGLLTGQPRTANAVAKSNMTLFKIGRIGFDEVTAENQGIRETIWLTYSWHVFDNFQRKSTFPKVMNKKERQAWFMKHFIQSMTIGQKVEVPQGGAYAFILMGSLRVGAETYNSPNLSPVTNIKEVHANKNSRILWLPAH